MTERQKDILLLTGLLVFLVLFYSKILFTGKIIRAPDIINEFYWWAADVNSKPFWEAIKIDISSAGWDIYTNSGSTVGGGTHSVQFLYPLRLILNLIPRPANVAWLIIMQLFFGAAGTYTYCRIIGCSRFGSFFSGLVFALATENASLINAGHVMKIATISYAPWAFVCLEKGYLARRPFWFMATAVVLAFQFFNTHWQIAYYTCLCVGMYGIVRTTAMIISDHKQRGTVARRLIGLNFIVLLFFLSTVAISLIPLANWSKDTNRGVQSGANQGNGGLSREEAMSWSLPPEETVAFVIPGFFGLSRQEAGPNPPGITSYYWGRMVFTQTASYFGLLPWLLLPLPLLFRRDQYTWLAVAGVAGGILFSMGKYTPFYNLLYDYFPGINHFRVPKMMMFIPVFGIGVLSARGIDLLMEPGTRDKKIFKRYLVGLVSVPVLLLLFWGLLQVWRDTWISIFIENLMQPTRYEQGEYLVSQRWNNLMLETGIAAVLASLAVGTVVFGTRMKKTSKILPALLMLLYLVDVWRVNDKFIFLTDAPVKAVAGEISPLLKFLKTMPQEYRILPFDGSDPMQYVSNKIPVMFTSNPVQQQRWQDFLDNFNINSAMSDMLNVKYLVFSREQFEKERSQISNKFSPVYQSPDGLQLVLENQGVLPKAWLVSSVMLVNQPQQALTIMQNPQFNPRQLALVETVPPIPLPQIGGMTGRVVLEKYEGEKIDLSVNNAANSLLVLGEKYYRGWKATVDGKTTEIVPVNHILRGVYLTPGSHQVEFVFDPLPFKIGKYLTLTSFALFAGMLIREWRLLRSRVKNEE